MRLSIGIPLIVKNVKLTGPSGSISIDMILDTGAALTVVSWADLKIIGYDPAIIEERQKIITANGVIEVPILKLKQISAGDIAAKGVNVICHDIPELASIRGMLGLSFLKNFRLLKEICG
jgi:clan AA aspartic protease (TIGR02281 family)